MCLESPCCNNSKVLLKCLFGSLLWQLDLLWRGPLFAGVFRHEKRNEVDSLYHVGSV